MNNSAHALGGVPGADDFAVLRTIIQEHGLLDRQPLYYTRKVMGILVLLGIGIFVLFASDSLWLQLLNAVYMAFVFGQIGLLFHDAGHRQIFGVSRKDDWVGYLSALCLGLSPQSWMEVHNAHHAHPNREDSDPDIDLPFFAYSEEQIAERQGGLQRLIVRNQGQLYFPLLTLTAFSLRATGLQYILRHGAKAWREACVFCLHFILYIVLLFVLLPWWHAALFILIHQTLSGLYMGSIFAPNHKGMPILEKETQIDFLREQTLTSRNIRSSSLIDFWYGGLNYQIEHHLFPTMPRNNLRRAHAIVQEFCKQRGIPYHETGLIQSYREIVAHMKHIGSLARKLEI